MATSRSLLLGSVCVVLLIAACTATTESPSFQVNGSALTFVSMGDWGSVNSIQGRVAHSIAASAQAIKAQFMLALGDNFYEAGVTNDTDPQWTKTYRNVFNQTALNIPWLAILGNHDHYGNPQAEVDYYINKRDTRWFLPSFWYTSHFAFPSGLIAQIVFIDTVILDPAKTLAAIMDQPDNQLRTDRLASFFSRESIVRREKLAADQWVWIENTLKAANESKWLFVAGHYPVYSGGEHGDSKVLIAKLQPLMAKYKVDGYFCGHDHNLQFLQDSGVNFYHSGNAAKTNGRYTPVPQNRWGNLVNGYTTHSLTETDFTTQWLNADGAKVYEVVQKQTRA